MRATSALIALLGSFASVVCAQLAINTPVNAVVCEPTLITWSGGTPPYFLTVLPAGSPGGPALVDLGVQTGVSTTWNTNVAAGTSVVLGLRDSTGAFATSAAFTINPGPDKSCL
ncbi:hypothetical protein B0H34DRAFT_727284 [Crassisporium funariophilum]|nr:hypothetical protein B0H34DRAFT_727284 [Crassisporium funariophilum]